MLDVDKIRFTEEYFPNETLAIWAHSPLVATSKHIGGFELVTRPQTKEFCKEYLKRDIWYAFYGRLREPIQKLIQWAKLLRVETPQEQDQLYEDINRVYALISYPNTTEKLTLEQAKFESTSRILLLVQEAIKELKEHPDCLVNSRQTLYAQLNRIEKDLKAELLGG